MILFINIPHTPTPLHPSLAVHGQERVKLLFHLFNNYLIGIVAADSLQTPVPVEVDSRYYKHLIGSVPPESHSVPLILHCLLEQVHFCPKICIFKFWVDGAVPEN